MPVPEPAMAKLDARVPLDTCLDRTLDMLGKYIPAGQKGNGYHGYTPTHPICDPEQEKAKLNARSSSDTRLVRTLHRLG